MLLILIFSTCEKQSQHSFCCFLRELMFSFCFYSPLGVSDVLSFWLSAMPNSRTQKGMVLKTTPIRQICKSFKNHNLLLTWHQTHYLEGIDKSYRITWCATGKFQLAPGIKDIIYCKNKYLFLTYMGQLEKNYLCSD